MDIVFVFLVSEAHPRLAGVEAAWVPPGWPCCRWPCILDWFPDRGSAASSPCFDAHIHPDIQRFPQSQSGVRAKRIAGAGHAGAGHAGGWRGGEVIEPGGILNLDMLLLMRLAVH